MENRNIELTRFQKKAQGYRAAHQFAPHARDLEVLAIGATIEGYRRDHGLSQQELVVADLMAGTGFLCDALYKLGFRNLHALEACNDMSQKVTPQPNQNTYTKHSFADISKVSAILDSLSPHIIVCLAGFHHIIKYNTDGNTVDLGKSIELQGSVVQSCVNSLKPEGMLIIADIYDDTLASEGSCEWPYWSTGQHFKEFLSGSSIPAIIIDDLASSSSFERFQVITLSSLSSNKGNANPSFHWFRDAVDVYSEIGHKDAALNKALIDDLRKQYQTSVFRLTCPWVFGTVAALKNFLQEFWFNGSLKQSYSLDNIYQEASRINGINEEQGFASFGWNLLYTCIVKPGDEESQNRRLARINLTLGSTLLFTLSLVNVALKHLTFMTQIQEKIDGVVLALFGYIGGDIYERIQKWIIRRR